MQQMARNLTDVDDGFLLNSRYLIMDVIQNTPMLSEDIWTERA